MIDTQNVFDQPVKNDLTTFDGIQKIKTGQRDDYATGFLLVQIEQELQQFLSLLKKQKKPFQIFQKKP